MKFGLKNGSTSNRLRRALAFALAVACFGTASESLDAKPAEDAAAKGRAVAAPKKPLPARPKAKTKAKIRTAPKHRHRAPRSRVPLQTAPPGTPAAKYAALGAKACHDELTRRGVAYRVERSAPGVGIPIRFTGKVAGVLFRSDLPDKQRAGCPWEVFDCRLALSVYDFAQLLRRRDVVEVRIFSAWRPPSKQQKPTVLKRHPGALAVDVRSLRKENGEELVVLDHFEGRLGAKVCDSDRQPKTPQGRELLAIVCEASQGHFFNSILTPNYDAEHQNHFHLELTPSVSWFMLR